MSQCFSKILLWSITIMLGALCPLKAQDKKAVDNNEICSGLLVELDKTIANRDTYTKGKLERIDSLRREVDGAKTLDESYRKKMTLAGEYETFVSDSVLKLLSQCLAIAHELDKEEYKIECSLRMAMAYSTSGLFVAADSIFSELDYNSLEVSQNGLYCYARIRYCENMIQDIDDARFSAKYSDEIDWRRDELMKSWDTASLPHR